MTSICWEQNAQLRNVHRGDPASDRRWVAAAREALKQLQRLNPPRRDKKRLRAAFAHWSKGLDDLDDLVHAYEGKMTRESNEAFRSMATEVRAIAHLLPDYPASACWGPAP
jgi:hypothetical protein